MAQFQLTPEIRKQLFRIYNDVNKAVYGFGTNESKIYFVDNMIIFNAHHNRVPCLMALEQDTPALKEAVDGAIMKVFKARLGERLQEVLGIRPKAVLRDYACDQLIAITVVVLDDE